MNTKDKISIMALINIFFGFLYKDFYSLALFLFSGGIFGKTTIIAEKKSIACTVLGIICILFFSYIFFEKKFFSKKELSKKTIFLLNVIFLVIGIILGTFLGGILN